MKNLTFNILSRIIVIVLQIVYLKIYTNSLNLNEIGIYYYLLAISYIANAFLFLPLDYYQQARMGEIIYKAGGMAPILNLNYKLLKIYVLLSIIFSIISYKINPEYLIYSLVAEITAYLIYASNALRTTLGNINAQKTVSISYIQESLAKVLIFSMIISTFSGNAITLAISWALSLIIAICYLSYSAKKLNLFKNNNSVSINTKDVFIFSFPFFIGAGLNWVQMQGYRLVLIPLGYSSVIGVYETLSGIGGTAFGAISMIYNQHFTPKIYQTKGQYTLQYIKGAIIIATLFSLAFIIPGQYVVGLLTNIEFIEYWPLIFYGIGISCLNMINGAFGIKRSIDKNTNSILYSSLLSTIVALLGFYILYIFNSLNSYTVGIPLIFSQFSGAMYQYLSIVKK